MLTHHQHDLAEQIKRLEADRERHAQAMTDIDNVLSRIRDALDAVKVGPSSMAMHRPGQRLAAFFGEVPPPRRHRGRFAQTATESVLNFIRERGNPSTAEINAHWRAEGRKGTVNVTLLKLLKDGLITRRADPTVRGSRYVITAGSTPGEQEGREIPLSA